MCPVGYTVQWINCRSASTSEWNHLEVSGSILPTGKITNNNYYSLTFYPIIVKRTKTIYHRKLNKEFSSKFCVGSWVWHNTPEDGRRGYRLKRSEYNNENEGNCPNILSDKNYRVSSQKFMTIIFFVFIGDTVRRMKLLKE